MSAGSAVPASAVVVRPATTPDLDAVALIERDAFSEPWSRRSFGELLHLPHAVFLVAEHGAGVIGYAVLLVVADQSELTNLATARESRGRGIGRQLLYAVIAEARQRGAKSMFLEVRESNAVAQALYRSAGFKEIARRRRYYQQPVEDGLVMTMGLR